MLDLLELRFRGLDRADNVALQDEVEIADGAGLHLLEQALQRDAARTLLRALLAAHALAAHVREVLRLALVLDDARYLARGRRLSKPRISTGSPGFASLIFSPL